MSACSPICARTLPVSGFGACKIRPRKGGISHLVFKACDVEVPENPVLAGNVVNPTAWLPLLTDCKLRISPEILGQKPIGNTTSRRFASCRPEQVVSGTKTITFQDFTSTHSFLDYHFWNHIMENETAYEVGWITCDGRFYGFYNFSIYVDEIIEDSISGATYKEGTVTIEETQLFVPLEIIGFSNLLNQYSSYDCTIDDFITDTPSVTELIDFNNP